jgi:hypothetical protein
MPWRSLTDGGIGINTHANPIQMLRPFEHWRWLRKQRRGLNPKPRPPTVHVFSRFTLKGPGGEWVPSGLADRLYQAVRRYLKMKEAA